MTNYKKFEDHLYQQLADKEYAKTYLEVALEDYEETGNNEEFLLALNDIVKAQGGVAHLAEATNLNRESLYRTLSSKGNPRLSSLNSILHALGFRFAIQNIQKKSRSS